MHISWLGHSAFKIETKTPLKEEVSLLLNPYLFPKADLPRNLKSDIVLLTQGAENTITLSGDPFIISTPGEYEIQGVMIYAMAISDQEAKPQIIYHFETELMSLAYMGNFQGKLTEENIDKLGVVDIALLPCGSRTVLTAEEAKEMVSQIEPRLVVPHSFNPPGGNFPYDPIDKFAKLLGQKEKEWLPKLKVNRRDLPQEETRLILLNKS